MRTLDSEELEKGTERKGMKQGEGTTGKEDAAK